MDKDAVFHDVQRQVQAFTKDRGIPEEGWCLYYAVYGTMALKKLGLRAVLQAGSAGWMRIKPEEDDGVIATHFSYMWTPTEPISRAALARGLMPEMHAWIALPDEQTIVDFTSGMFPAHAKRMGGVEWTGPLPPLYFWGTEEDLNGGFYRPDVEAITFALKKVLTAMSRDYLDQLLERVH
jgi:hypothetical protein